MNYHFMCLLCFVCNIYVFLTCFVVFFCRFLTSCATLFTYYNARWWRQACWRHSELLWCILGVRQDGGALTRVLRNNSCRRRKKREKRSKSENPIPVLFSNHCAGSRRRREGARRSGYLGRIVKSARVSVNTNENDDDDDDGGGGGGPASEPLPLTKNRPHVSLPKIKYNKNKSPPDDYYWIFLAARAWDCGRCRVFRKVWTHYTRAELSCCAIWDAARLCVNCMLLCWCN